CQIDLGDDRHIRRIDDRRILERFVLAFRNRKQDRAKILPEVITGRADEIAHVLDEQEIEWFREPILHGPLNHGGIEVTDRSRRDLTHGSVAARQTRRVVVRSEIADQSAHMQIPIQRSEHLLKEHRLAGPWAGHNADDERSCFTETRAQFPGEKIVLFQHTLAHFDKAGLHHSTSTPTTSRSVAAPSWNRSCEPSAPVPSQARRYENKRASRATPASGPTRRCTASIFRLPFL